MTILQKTLIGVAAVAAIGGTAVYSITPLREELLGKSEQEQIYTLADIMEVQQRKDEALRAIQNFYVGTRCGFDSGYVQTPEQLEYFIDKCKERCSNPPKKYYDSEGFLYREEYAISEEECFNFISEAENLYHNFINNQ